MHMCVYHWFLFSWGSSAKISRHAKESLIIPRVPEVAADGVSLLYLHHRIVDNCSLAFCCTCQLFISQLDVFAGGDDKGLDEDRVRVIPTPWGATPPTQELCQQPASTLPPTHLRRHLPLPWDPWTGLNFNHVTGGGSQAPKSTPRLFKSGGEPV